MITFRLAAGLAAAGLFAAFATPSAAEVLTTSYLCERGVEIPVTYANAEDPAVAVLMVEGRFITLFVEQAASGSRYGWPSDGSHYVWWEKGGDAILLWHDGETGEESMVYASCVAS